MTEGIRKWNWETKSKRKRIDEEWNIDLRNDRRKKERKLRDEKWEKKEWWGMKYWIKEWQKEEGKETEKRKLRENELEMKKKGRKWKDFKRRKIAYI